MAVPPTILIVDDDAMQRLILDATLTRSGYVVLSAADAIEAMTLLDANRVDLVVTDIHMPGPSGMELVKAMRAKDAFRATPVIVLTGSEGPVHDEVALMDAGADDYIRKPIEPMRLVARIRALFRRTGTRDVDAPAEWAASELSAVKRVSRQLSIPPEALDVE